MGFAAVASMNSFDSVAPQGTGVSLDFRGLLCWALLASLWLCFGFRFCLALASVLHFAWRSEQVLAEDRVAADPGPWSALRVSPHEECFLERKRWLSSRQAGQLGS